jgi:hypothetical protein
MITKILAKKYRANMAIPATVAVLEVPTLAKVMITKILASKYRASMAIPATVAVLEVPTLAEVMITEILASKMENAKKVTKIANVSMWKKIVNTNIQTTGTVRLNDNCKQIFDAELLLSNKIYDKW